MPAPSAPTPAGDPGGLVRDTTTEHPIPVDKSKMAVQYLKQAALTVLDDRGSVGNGKNCSDKPDKGEGT